MYEDLELIPKAERKPNGYRVFTDLHMEQFRLARMAFEVEVLQNGLRKEIIEVVKRSAKKRYDEAIVLTYEYIESINAEMDHAREAVEITKKLLDGVPHENSIFMKRKEVSDALGITMDTLRNWEMNGLLKIKRKENGYRVYSEEDLQKLKIIRSLRCANYSLSAILRMMNAVNEDPEANILKVLNTPEESEDIVSVCDNLIIVLAAARENAERIVASLIELKRKYGNPPL